MEEQAAASGHMELVVWLEECMEETLEAFVDLHFRHLHEIEPQPIKDLLVSIALSSQGEHCKGSYNTDWGKHKVGLFRPMDCLLEQGQGDVGDSRGKILALGDLLLLVII